jgi:hypothetical protein
MKKEKEKRMKKERLKKVVVQYLEFDLGYAFGRVRGKVNGRNEESQRRRRGMEKEREKQRK